jgi:uncharacterized coiled-coil protein SlyX
MDEPSERQSGAPDEQNPMERQDDTLRRRIEALERAVTDGDHDLSTLAGDADIRERLQTVETRLDELETTVTELDAATQALRGYVGNLRSVNRDVERQAEAALAKVEELQTTPSGDGTKAQGDTAVGTNRHHPADSLRENQQSGENSGDGHRRRETTHPASDTRCRQCVQPPQAADDTEPLQSSRGGRDSSALSTSETENPHSAHDCADGLPQTDHLATPERDRASDPGPLERLRELV